MQLNEYGLKVTIFDPDDKGTKVTVTVDRVPRDKVLTVPFPLAETLKRFEEGLELREG